MAVDFDVLKRLRREPPPSSVIAASGSVPINGGILTYTPTSAVFTDAKGNMRWSVDQAAFAGQPLLSVTLSGLWPAIPANGERPRPNVSVVGRASISLTGGLYPGTSIPADFTLNITRTVFVVKGNVGEFGTVSFTCAFLNLSISGNLDVLGGITRAATVPAFSIKVANQGTITSSGGSASALAIPGSVSMSASGIASAALLGESAVPLNNLSITVLRAVSPSLFQVTPPVRSGISVNASPGVFTVPAPASQTVLGTLTKVADLFTTLDIELGVEANGTTVCALFFGGSQAGTQFQLQLSDTVFDQSGNTPTFPLSVSNQICVFDTNTTSFELTACVNPESAVVRALNVGFQLATTDAQNSHFVWNGTQSTSAWCSLPVSSAVPQLDGAVAVSRQGLTVSLLGQGLAPDPVRDVNWIKLGALPAGEPRITLQTIAFELLRIADLLDLQLDGVGLALTVADDGNSAIISVDSNQPGQLIATFAPQHLAERDYYRADPNFVQPGDPQQDDQLDAPPIPVRMAGQSHLALQFPHDYTMPLTLEGLLGWAPLSTLPPLMGFDPPRNFEPNPFPPLPIETGIELPYRIFISPNQNSGWSHDAVTVQDSIWTPLWHTRLGVRKPTNSDPSTFFVDERDTPENIASRTVRPVFSWEYFPPPQPSLNPPLFPTPPSDNSLEPFRMAVTLADRFDIIERSAYTLNKSATPEPVTVSRLMLSALGAWFSGSVTWTDQLDTSNPLQAWRHITSQGRDQYVRITKRGHLFPFGHAASWVKISERQFTGGTNNPAYLIERDFIVVTQHRRDYASLQQFNWNGRDLPLTEIEILTETTPPLDAPSSQMIAGTNAFWIFQNGAGFPFQMRALDIPTTADPSGQHQVPLQAIAIFVPDGFSLSDVQLISQAYNAAAPVTSIGGQKVTLAESSVPGDTTYGVHSFIFVGGTIGGQLTLPNGEPNFYPSVDSAIIDLPAVQQLGSLATDISGGTQVRYLPSYLANGLDTGTETFASLASGVGVAFANDSGNGVGSPSMQIAGLSRKFGTVAGQNGVASLKQLVEDKKFTPLDFFQKDANILGTFPVSKLVQPLLSDLNFPALKLDTSDPAKLVALFTWTPELNQGVSVGPASLNFSPNFNPPFPGKTTSLAMTTRIVTPLNQQQAAGDTIPNVDAKLTGSLQNFQLNFLGLVVLTIDQLTFTAEKGKKPSLDVSLDSQAGVSLGPSLGLLETLADALAGLLGGGPSIDVSSGQIVASYSLPLPSIGLGVFSLENIALNTSLTIPLTNAPLSFGFSFSSQQNPFTVSVEMIGGGGYFEIAADVQQGLIELTFEIQAGVSASIDLGLASGSVSIMIGVLFQFVTADTTITGYFRADGELTVLRLISLHVTFYLGLTYDINSGALWGEADVTVEVSVLFFDKSVTLTMRKQFAGPPPHPVQGAMREAGQPRAQLPGHPPFGSIMTESDWQTYAAAFA